LEAEANVSRASTLESARLTLRPFLPADIAPLYAIQRDREAMQYTWSSPGLAASERHLRAHAEQRERHGVAPWTVVERASGDVIGWGGLSVDPDEPEWGVEVVYFVRRDHWGRGIASEIVEAALDHGFAGMELEAIGAFARPANAASLRVLEKAGFQLLSYVERLERNHYMLRREHWLERREPRAGAVGSPT